LLDVQVDDRDVRALTRVQNGNGAADAGIAAGNQRNLAVELTGPVGNGGFGSLTLVGMPRGVAIDVPTPVSGFQFPVSSFRFPVSSFQLPVSSFQFLAFAFRVFSFRRFPCSDF
jgi:hypothetical protein